MVTVQKVRLAFSLLVALYLNQFKALYTFSY